MFEKLKRAVDTTARSGLDAVYQQVTHHWSNGLIDDEQTQTLYERIEQRRRSIFPERQRRRRKPTTELVRAQRRQLANSGPMPSHLAACFTTCELAVLAIVAYSGGVFDRTIKELADRAGVGHSTVQKALRTAERLGLISIEERRVAGKKNLPNVVRIVSLEWRTWLERGGSKKLKPLDTRFILSCNSRVSHPHIPTWKRLISRTSPGRYAIQSPQRR
jgi:hypothetical protein